MGWDVLAAGFFSEGGGRVARVGEKERLLSTGKPERA